MPESPTKSPPHVLIVGATTPAGEQLLDALASGPRPPLVVAADVGEAVGAEFDWRGEAEVVADLDRLAGEIFDVVVVASPTGGRSLPASRGPRLHLPGTGGTGRVVWPERTARPGAGETVRLPCPLAGLVADVLTALAPLGPVAGVEVASTEAASGAGRAGMDELRDQTVDLLNFREPMVRVFPHRLAFDAFPLGPVDDDEFAHDFGQLWPELPAMAVRTRVPAFVGLAAHLRLELAEAPALGTVRSLLSAAGGTFDEAVTLVSAVGLDGLLLAPPRVRGKVLHLWFAADDTRAGIALPAARLVGAW